MAGASSTGASVARSVVPSRSSAMPAVIFAIEFAVAGATTTRSAFCQRDVADAGDVVVDARRDGVPTDGLPRRQPHEAQRVLRRHDRDVVPGLREQSHEVHCLVGGDSSGDSHDDVHGSILPHGTDLAVGPRAPRPRLAGCARW